ncbi:hypothetical protein JMUB7544_18180 [Staphylococcus aureus]
MNYTLQCYIDCGPKHREFRKEILQAMRVGSGAPIKFQFLQAMQFFVSSHQVQS